MKVSATTKSKLTRLLNSKNEVTTNHIVDIIQGDLDLDSGYEPEVVVDLMNSLLDVIADRRRAIDFAGHSIPEKILTRIQQMVKDGKLLEVRY